MNEVQQNQPIKPRQAPSVEAVKAYYRGEKDSVARLLGTYFGRSALLALGFYIFSEKKAAVKNGLIGSGIIELYLLWYFRNKNKNS